MMEDKKQLEGSRIHVFVLAVIFSLLPGALFLSIMQTLGLQQGRGGIILATVLSFIIPFFIVSLAGIFFTFLSKLPFRQKSGLKGPALLACVYSLALILCSFYGGFFINGFSSSLKINLVLMGLLLLISLTALFWSAKDSVTWFKALVLFAVLAGLAVPWGIKMPEWSFLSSPYKFYINALSLSVIIGLAFRLRQLVPLSFRVDAAAVLVLLAACFFMNVYASSGRVELPNQGFAEESGKSYNAARSDMPNIIFIVWDTVRRDHMGVYGYHRNTTPYLEERAKESVIYTNAVSVSSYTLPSHASMFTGLYPYSHGAHDSSRADARGEHAARRVILSDTFNTLAEKLHELGYTCGGVSSNYIYAGKSVNIDQGFDFFDDPKNIYYSSIDIQVQLLFVDLLNRFARIYLYFPEYTPTIIAESVTDRALEWIDSTRGDRPFFLFMNYMDAHLPYYPPPDLVYAFADRAEAVIRNNDEPFNDNEIAWMNSEYDSCILYLDRELRRFEQELRKRSLFKDAFIVLVSDHGEFLGEYGLNGHGYDVFAELVNIPLILKYPGKERVGVVDSIIENRGLYFIVLEAAGANPEVPEMEWDAVCEEYAAIGEIRTEVGQRTSESRISRAVYFDQYKFYNYSDGEERLYDYIKDPYEKNDILQNLPESVEKGRILIKSFLDKMPQAVEEQGIERPGHDQIRDLKALGYVK